MRSRRTLARVTASALSAADDMTVERLVSFGRTPHLGLMGIQGDEDEKYVEWAMEVTNITEYRDREISRLSGGQRQRVWIAMALAQGTEILFLDEPTTYLDIRTSEIHNKKMSGFFIILILLKLVILIADTNVLQSKLNIS